MLNTFDFWTVTAHATRVRDLLAAGIDRAACRKARTGWKRVGRAAYPTYRWEAVVAYVDAIEPNGRERVAAAEAKCAACGVATHVRYECRD